MESIKLNKTRQRNIYKHKMITLFVGYKNDSIAMKTNNTDKSQEV